MKKFRVAIIGRPNVGKSSLFNRIVGWRKAIVHDVAGTTRDIVSEKISLDGKSFELLDTAGYLREKEPLNEKALEKVKEAIKEANLLLLVMDGSVMPTKEDLAIADMARKSGKDVILALNKIDNPNKDTNVSEYQKLGFKNIFLMSVIHNLGVVDLLEELQKAAINEELAKEKPSQIRISIIGRPNVGKSSILNAVIGEERAIVSNIPGTTRDVVSETIHGKDFDFMISDTAGARKPGKIGKAAKQGEPVEKYSFLRTQKEVENSDIVLLVLDASDRIAAQDLHIAGMARELGKGIIILINKWDLVEETTQESFLARLRREFNFMIWVPAIFVSAVTKRNIGTIMDVVEKVHANQTQTIATSKLNRIMEDYVLDNPPKGLKNLKPKVFFVSQTGVTPPTFTISAKQHAFIHFSWKRAFENELRRHFDFTGTPIKIEFKEK